MAEKVYQFSFANEDCEVLEPGTQANWFCQVAKSVTSPLLNLEIGAV